MSKTSKNEREVRKERERNKVRDERVVSVVMSVKERRGGACA